MRTRSPAGRPLIVVSNREPYLHEFAPDGTIRCTPTTGGVAVALDALMRERSGVWIAHGAGAADRLVVGPDDRLLVPPDSPAYWLRRIWLSDEEFARYYQGFANEGLWPLCHVVPVKPTFRAEDWRTYQAVNERFAAAVDEELARTEASPPVFIQDYHLALVAPALRARRPDVRTALFWHIPWPNPDRLRICPWRRELLEGLLANDLVAFQLERDRRNFLQAVRDELGAEIRRGLVSWAGRRIRAVAVPIGVDYDRIQRLAASPALAREIARLRRELGIDTPLVGVGVDRLDYIKGIPERLEALDVLLARRPDLRRRLTFVQVAVPSRTGIAAYREVEAAIDAKVAEINARYGESPTRGPIRYRKSALRGRRLVALYRLANFCIVSSLHDGMNLVAKEFVASRQDLDGVLILSELAGAAQELREAVIINPYEIESFADAIEAAIEMPPAERQRRMRALRKVVAGRNVFSWASDILEGLEELEAAPPAVRTGRPGRFGSRSSSAVPIGARAFE